VKRRAHVLPLLTGRCQHKTELSCALSVVTQSPEAESQTTWRCHNLYFYNQPMGITGSHPTNDSTNSNQILTDSAEFDQILTDSVKIPIGTIRSETLGNSGEQRHVGSQKGVFYLYSNSYLPTYYLLTHKPTTQTT
jgi:hypothetical protein